MLTVLQVAGGDCCKMWVCRSSGVALLLVSHAWDYSIQVLIVMAE